MDGVDGVGALAGVGDQMHVTEATRVSVLASGPLCMKLLFVFSFCGVFSVLLVGESRGGLKRGDLVWMVSS